ncbi:MAG TPA: GlsB/YeaQ/YmgE family stress response membrane protein [Aggregatilineales bacterium]|nr:GlsB/YeaQ/YmgE family stress response membrane protein [Aggregatilineales bacterium]
MSITLDQLIVWIIVGAIAGWLAGLLMRGHGLGTLGNIIVGLLGALVGGILFTLLHITVPSFLNGSLTIKIADIFIAFIGAIVVFLIVSLLRRRGV